jgi:hypothetical protein
LCVFKRAFWHTPGGAGQRQRIKCARFFDPGASQARHPGRGNSQERRGAGDAFQQRKNKKDNKFVVDNIFVVCYIGITPNAKGM